MIVLLDRVNSTPGDMSGEVIRPSCCASYNTYIAQQLASSARLQLAPIPQVLEKPLALPVHRRTWLNRAADAEAQDTQGLPLYLWEASKQCRAELVWYHAVGCMLGLAPSWYKKDLDCSVHVMRTHTC
jgi:hypothetical protein